MTIQHDNALKILLVEDDDDHAELVKRSLDEHCVANMFKRVADGQQALDYLMRKGDYSDLAEPLPNLILLDLRLPKVDGFEVLKRLKHDDGLKQIPVVILTSSESECDIAKAYENYANSYLVKPLDFACFTKMMKTLGYYWLGWNKYPENR